MSDIRQQHLNKAQAEAVKKTVGMKKKRIVWKIYQSLKQPRTGPPYRTPTGPSGRKMAIMTDRGY